MLKPPIPPMLARLTDALPVGDGWLFEPKWDGFRALVFKDGDEVYLQSRDSRPFARYFPELVAPLRENLPARCVVDGEIVIAGPSGLDFDALLLRIHPAASRIAKLAKETPASFVAFDLLWLDERDLRAAPNEERRAALERALDKARHPVHLTPATRDRAVAEDWFERFEGAGLDGVIARRLDDAYHPDKRTMLKVKHARTADCVVGGFRWHKQGPGTLVGSLLLGLYDREGVLHHVGVTSSFTMKRRAELVSELAPYRERAEEDHPWRGWSGVELEERRPGMTSRWNRGKDLSWIALRPELVVEVGFDHLQGDRFRHAATFKRFRFDKRPADCTYDQLEEAVPYELGQIFGQ